MDTLIIQSASDIAATKSVLEGVAKHNEAQPNARLKVYVGLKYEALVTTKTAAELASDVREDLEVARTVVNLNVPFDGWYIAREFYNFGDAAYGRVLRDNYVTPLVKALRSDEVAKPDVLVSPYFNPACGSELELAGPKATAQLFTTLFADAKLNVLLQDGMGAKNHDRHCRWADIDYLPQMTAYEIEFRRAFGDRAWVNAESFEEVVEGSDPSTSWKRFERQLRAVPAATRVVTYDYYLNMNPVNSTPAAKRLYADYVRAVGKDDPCREFLVHP